MNFKINFFLGSALSNVYQTYGVQFLQNDSAACNSSLFNTQSSGRLYFLIGGNPTSVIDGASIGKRIDKIVYYPSLINGSTLPKIYLEFTCNSGIFIKSFNSTTRKLEVEFISEDEDSILNVNSVFINNSLISLPHQEPNESKIIKTLLYSVNLKSQESSEVNFLGDVNCLNQFAANNSDLGFLKESLARFKANLSLLNPSEACN